MPGALGGTQYGSARHAAGVPAKSSGIAKTSGWNPGDASGTVAFRAKQVLSSATTGNKGARGFRSQTVKGYLEGFIQPGGNTVSLGLATASSAFANFNNTALVWTNNSGVYYNNAQQSTTNAYACDLIMLACDNNSSTAYIGINGVWFNSSDPVRGIGGYAFSSPLFPFAAVYAPNDAAIINTGDSPFAYAIPAGYQAWG